MATKHVDAIIEQLNRLIADPRVAARIDAFFVERERQGEQGRGIHRQEMGRRLGLPDNDGRNPEDDEDSMTPWQVAAYVRGDCQASSWHQ
jgi:hypothetical protein